MEFSTIQKEVHFFTPDSSQLQNFRNSEQFHHEEEKKYQTLWQRYFVKQEFLNEKT